MDWHALSLRRVMRLLAVDLNRGLTGEEAAWRLARYGPNALPPGKTDSVFVIVARQFASPLIYVLLAAALVVYLLGDRVDALIILAVLTLNAVVGSLQEGRAQNTLAALKEFSESAATVLRDGKEFLVPDRDVAPGDVLLVREGEKIAADARLVESVNLKLDEAALTGESIPVHKEPHSRIRANAPLAERTNMLFKGTFVVSGSGRAVAVGTGLETAIGAISREVAGINTEIPLKGDIRRLSRVIIGSVFCIAALLFGVGITFGKPAEEMFRTMVALSVSIIPEGLPVVLTIVLAAGTWRMAKRSALVKRLQAVEALGQVSVIAVDKTGTLTKNEMVVREVFAGGAMFIIGGTGYEPKGDVTKDSKIIAPPNHPELLRAAKIAACAASASAAYDESRGRWRVSGDPTEAAMAVFGEKLGFYADQLLREMPLLAELPFDYATKYHAKSYAVAGMGNGDGGNGGSDRGGGNGGAQFTVIAGAPEAILAHSTRADYAGETDRDSGSAPLTDERRAELERVFHGMSRRGLRVVAFAYRETPFHDRARPRRAIEVDHFVFAGFYGIEDSLRPEVPEAMARAAAAGIRVVMITGDHKLTAAAIAREAGIWREGDPIYDGDEIDRMSDAALHGAVRDARVFARVTPEHKLRIVRAYRAQKIKVAMTGDGVNDAPSLVAADLGVAMGLIGTEVTKRAADIVLLDDNFGTIIAAVEEGRSIYMTIKKVILYLFSTSLGEVLTIAGAIVAGFPLPVTPVQILWLNLITDGFLVLALAVEPKEPDLLARGFRKPAQFFVDRTMVVRMIVMAMTMMIGTLILFRVFYPHDLARGWTVALTVLAAFQWLNAWNARSERVSLFRQSPLANPYLLLAIPIVIGLQIAAVYLPPLQAVLRTVPLTAVEWGLIAAVACAIVVTEEIRKLVVRVKSVISPRAAPALFRS